MAQIIVLDFATGVATVYTYDDIKYPDTLDIINELNDSNKISSIDDCQWMAVDGILEIEYETL